jgi:DNA-binding response OmpR family regulator
MSQPEEPKIAKILIIDDKENVARSLCSLLESVGYEALSTCDPDSFVDVIESEKPDLALVDVIMPQISGDRLARMARDKLGSACCPILLWSSKPPSELESLAAISGANGYLHKSADTDEMLQIIRRFVG